VLILLIGIGAGLGAALGAAGSAGSSVLAGAEAQQWLTGVLTTTEAAGTAHLDSTSVTTGPNSSLRDSGAGSGVVDFATGSYRVNETDRIAESSPQNGGPTSLTTTVEEIVIGRSDYVNFGVPGFLPDFWTKQSTQRERGGLGLGSSAVFGPLLSALSGPFTALTVTRLGTATVGGVSATRYLAQTQLEPSTTSPCPARDGNPFLGRATVWVDGEGRLVQVRVQSSTGGKVPASGVKHNPSTADEPLGPITSTGTLRLSGFGAPVHVARPALDRARTALSVPIIGKVQLCPATELGGG
jgi:hypothetical protein